MKIPRNKDDIYEYIECNGDDAHGECGTLNLVCATDLLEDYEEVVVPLTLISNKEDRFRLMCDLLDEPYTATHDRLLTKLSDLLT